MIAFVFALPQESAGIVAALRSPVRSGSPALPVVRGKLGERTVLVLHSGVGAEAVRRTLAHYWEMRQTYGGRWEVLVTSGFAGGLDPALPAGTLVLAGNGPVQRARQILGERVRVGALASASEPVATPGAKAALFAETQALAVDMETAAVAAFCRENGVPWLALRAILDPAGAPLPVPYEVWFDAVLQRPRPGTLFRYLLMHPSRWLPFAAFLVNVARARRALAAALFKLAENL